MCGDFNDSYDPVHSLVVDEGFASVFEHIHGREARITHCNHNNREVGVDFIFASHLDSTRRAMALVADDTTNSEDSDDVDESLTTQALARMQLAPRACHLAPRRLSDRTRLKRPSFGHDWRAVEHPQDHHDDEVLVDYWRMVSDHRPLVATFDIVPPPIGSSSSSHVVL